MSFKKAVSFFSIFAFLVVSVFIISPASAAKTPKITKITPSSGVQGETVKVTIKGKNFNKKKTKNKVVVTGGGVAAKVTKASTKLIKAKLTLDADAEAGARKIYVKVGKKKSNKKAFTIEQACSYTLSKESDSFDFEGGSGTFGITAPTGCSWTAETDDSWIVITPTSGAGAGTITYTVDKNDTPDERTGLITVEDKVITVTQTSADVVAETTNSDLGTVDAAGWSSISGSEIVTTGNPATGGHGALSGELVTITLQAAHDDTYLYLRANWSDSSQNNTSSVWTYSTGEWSRAGSEDRMYMMFPITDVAGREGKTFAQAGCAMTCHVIDTNNEVVTNTTDTISSCGVCHPNSATDPGSSFVHITVTSQQTCSDCHADREPVGKADMTSPAGGAFDIWHWKAGRSAPLDLAEDQNTVGPSRRGGDGSALTSNNEYKYQSDSRPEYIWTPASGKNQSNIILASKLFGGGYYYSYDASDLWLSGELAVWNSTDSKYYAADTGSVTQTVEVESGGITKTVDIFTSAVEVVPTDGLNVRRIIYEDEALAEGSNADLISDSSYSNGEWTVVIKRKFDTGDSKDAKFESGKDYNFGIAVTDNSGINHKGSNLKTLLIQ